MWLPTSLLASRPRSVTPALGYVDHFGGREVAIVAIAIVAALLGLAGVWWTRRRAPSSAAAGAGEVRMVDPRELLFSLPTLADGVPPVVPDDELGAESNAAVLHEDDWRQVDFASEDDRRRFEGQLAAIRSHKERYRAGLGFRRVFVRPDPPGPLAGGGITLTELARELGARAPMPVYLRGGGSVGKAAGGFAVEVPGVGFVYGTEQGGRVGTLGLALVGAHPELGEIEALTRLSDRFDVLLVDWLRQETVPSREPARLRAWIATAVRDDSAPAT
jgi:hypothetical protein